MSTFFLCMNDPDTCFFCTEYAHVEGGSIMVDDHLFCSEECVEAYVDNQPQRD